MPRTKILYFPTLFLVLTLFACGPGTSKQPPVDLTKCLGYVVGHDCEGRKVSFEGFTIPMGSYINPKGESKIAIDIFTDDVLVLDNKNNPSAEFKGTTGLKNSFITHYEKYQFNGYIKHKRASGMLLVITQMVKMNPSGEESERLEFLEGLYDSYIGSITI